MALKRTSTVGTKAASPAQQGNLSPLDIAHVAYGAGFRGAKLTTAVAVSLAETGGTGNPKAVSSTNDHGLWQINQRWHPEYFKEQGRIYDPAYNAAAAFKISNGGTNWQPWTTYRTGAYKHYIGQGYPTGPGADKIIGAGSRSTSGGGWVPGLPDPGDIGNPIKWVDEAAKNIIAFLKIMVDPEKLGRHIANALVWLLKQFAKGVYNVIFLPPWRWTQRATIYYYENNIVADAKVGGQRYGISVKAIVTMAFWATGYAILWGRFEPVQVGVDARDSALANSIGATRDALVARRITKPKDVEKNTAKKPEPVATTVPLQVTRSVAANRRRTVKVTDTAERQGNGRGRNNDTAENNPAEVVSEETNQQTQGTPE